MGREIYELTDREYLRRDGQNTMEGPLQLSGPPTENNHAARKEYIDALIGALDTLTPTEIDALIAVLTQSGGTIDARIAAAVAAYLPLSGANPMTGDLTLAGAPTDNLHAATKLYVDTAVPAASLDTYDAVVAAAGGDYTSIVAACNGEGVGARIYIKPGTYNETADIDLKDGQQLIGANPDTTIIDFGAGNRQIVFAGATVNLLVQGLTVQNSIANDYIHLSGNYSKVDNCRLIGSANANDGVYFAGGYGQLTRTIFTGFTKAGTYCARFFDYGQCIGNTFLSSQRGLFMDDYGQCIGNFFRTMTNEQALFELYCTVVGNEFYGGQPIMISGQDTIFSGNYFASGADLIWDGTHDRVIITGNSFLTAEVNCTDAPSSDCVITGNKFVNGIGVYTDGDNFVISGNVFALTAFVELSATARACAITGNNLEGSTAGTRIVDAGVGNMAKSNTGLSDLEEKCFTRMKNTSGGALVAGDVVVIKAVAAGDEFDTTVAAGDDHVWGMLDEPCNNNAYALVQRMGKTVKLKVNGTVAIGIGDHLSTMNVAGIARKAAAAHMTFAMALEAYAVADSNGVINALLMHGHQM